MVKFTSTVVAASLLVGSALAVPYGRSDYVEVAARDGDHPHPHHHHHHSHHAQQQQATDPAVVAPAPDASAPSRRSYENVHAREHDDHHHHHWFHHHHSHAQQAPQTADPPPAPDAAPGRRSYIDYSTFDAREGEGSTSGVPSAHPAHSHHAAAHTNPAAFAKWIEVMKQIQAHQHGANGQHAHPHHAQAAVVPPVARRSYGGYYNNVVARDTGATGVTPPVVSPIDNSVAVGATHPHHQHAHAHHHHHLHNQQLASTAPPVTDSSSATPVVGAREVDFDEMYARMYEIDELD